MNIKDPVKARMTLEEALAKGEINNETKQFMERAIKQNEMIDRIMKEDFVRVWPHYTAQERQKITEEAEKENFLLFVKVLANPQQKVCFSGHDGVFGKADYFQCLTSAQVTQMVNNFPNKVKIDWYDYHAGIPFFASIKEVWASEVEANILLGKAKRDEKPPQPTKNPKLDRRKSDASDALHTLAKYVLIGGKGWKAFMDMLEADHTLDNPYEGCGDCTEIYVKGKDIYFTIKTENDVKKVKRSKVSLKYHFASANV